MCRSIFTLDELIDTISAPTHAAWSSGFLTGTEIDKQALLKEQFSSKYGAAFKGIDHKTKAPYLSFFLWSYLNTQNTALEVGTGTLNSDKLGQDLFEALAVIAKEEINGYFKDPEAEGEPTAPSRTKITNEKEACTVSHEEAAFVYDIYIPIIEKLAVDHFPSRDTSIECFAVIADTCTTFMARALEQFEHGRSHLNRFRNNAAVRCLDALKDKLEYEEGDKFSTEQLSALKSVLAKVSATGMNFLDAGMSKDARIAKYQTDYKEEQEKNAEFNSFVQNLKAANLGANTVKAQLSPVGYPVDGSIAEKLYNTPEKPEALPLGAEFQHLTALFCTFGKANSVMSTDNLGVLVRLWEAHSFITATASARELETFNNATEKSLDILLAAITNSQHISTNNADPKIQVQDQIVASNALLPIAFLMGSNSSAVQNAALTTLAAVMDGGNMQAQRIFERFFLDTREELFFENVSELLTLATESISEIRILRRQKEDADHAQDVLRKTMSGTIKALQQKQQQHQSTHKKGRGKSTAADVFQNASLGQPDQPSGLEETVFNDAYDAGPAKATSDEIVVSEKDPFDLGDGSHGHYEVLLSVLQSMCEGNNTIIQNYLRTQPDNIKDFNLITMVTEGLTLLLQETPIHIDSVPLVAQSVATLTEFCQGNSTNQRKAFDSRVFDCLNIMLRTEYGDLKAPKESGKKTQKGGAPQNDDAGRAKQTDALFMRHSNGGFLNRGSMERMCQTTTVKEYQRGSLSTQKWGEICQSAGADPDNGLTKSGFEKWCHSRFATGATFKRDAAGKPVYDENIVQMHLCAADLLGRMLETNNTETLYLAEQIDGMIELPAIVRLFREYSLLGGIEKDGINGSIDVEMELPISGKVHASDVAFSLYNVFVRLTAFTHKLYHHDEFLRSMDADFIQSHGDDMGTKPFTVAYEEMDKNTAIIEVMVGEVIEQVHFPIKKKWKVENEARDTVLWSVERGALTEQVADFMAKSKEIAANMKHTDKIRDKPFFAFLISSTWYLDWAFMFWTFVVNVAMILTWVAPHDSDSAVPVLQVPFTSHADVDGSDKIAEVVMQICGYVHVALTGAMLFSFYLTHPPSLWHEKWQDPLKKKDGEPEEEYQARLANSGGGGGGGGGRGSKKPKEVDIIRELRAEKFINEKRDMKHLPIFSATSFYYIFMMACSILGVIYHGYTFAFCLLHITRGNDILSRVLSSVTQNGISLLYVALLLVIIIYIYALAGFAYYREFYDREEGNFCYTMAQCFFTSLRLGLLSGGGLGDAFGYSELTPAYAFHKTGMPAGRIAFDISFFVLVTIIGLNVRLATRAVVAQHSATLINTHPLSHPLSPTVSHSLTHNGDMPVIFFLLLLKT